MTSKTDLTIDDPIYKGAIPFKKDALDEIFVDIIAEEAKRFIEINGMTQENDDAMVEKMLNYGTNYFMYFQALSNMQEKKGKNFVQLWMDDNVERFLEHNNSYLTLYKMVIELRNAPYFMTMWSVVFLVDLALKEFAVVEPDDYLKLNKEELNELDCLVKFGEDMILNFHSKVASLR